MKYVELLRSRPIAIETATANEQHYEVGTGVLANCLGPRMKYSCCLYPKGTETLAQAEIAMLESYVEKAQLQDGMRIFDLGYVQSQMLRGSRGSDICLDVDGALFHYTSRKSCQTPRSRLSRTLGRKKNTSTLKPKARVSRTSKL